MGGLFRKIGAYLCKPIYLLIVYMYKIFYNIATTRFLSTDVVQQLSANIYTLVSVVMLFAFSVTILSAIVNPDLLTDGKKGVTAMFKRAIIALVLMVIVPFGFDELYAIQESVMSNSLIEKIVVGINYSCESSDGSECEAGGNGGQVIAGTLISSVLHPEEKYMNDDGTLSVGADVSESYRKMVAEDISYLGAVAKNINVTVDDVNGKDVTDDDPYAFHFDGLIAIVVGLATVYILVIFSIDVAVRVFKLAFMELTAPISIVSYIAAGDKILSSWFKELGKTYAELFVRIAAIAFYLFLVHNLDGIMNNFTSSDWSFVLKAFLMVGMLIFAKQVPDLIGKVFGVEMKSQGGIAGRLGNMAGVGNVAKKAWEAVRNPIAAAAGVGSMALGTGAHIASAARTSFSNGKKAVQRIRADQRGLKGLRVVGAAASAIGSGAWGASVGSVSAAARSLKNGVNNKNLHSMKDEYDLYKDTHKEGSTVVGRTIDDIRRGTGFKSRAETKGEANEHLTNTATALNNMHSKARELLSQEDSARMVYTVRDAAGNVVRDSQGNLMSMNLHDANEYLETLQNSAPVLSDFKDANGNIGQNEIAQFNDALLEHQRQVQRVSEQIRNGTEAAETQVINDALNGNLNGTAEEIATSNELNNEFNTFGKEYKKTGDPNVSGLQFNRGNFAANMDQFERVVNTAIGENTAERDNAGNLTHYGRQKADSDSINNRPGNKSGGSSSGKDSGSSK